jgi:CheY-like chemotaxis protein
MINYSAPTRHRLAKLSCQDLSTVGAAAPQALPPSISMLEQGESGAPDTDSAPVPPQRLQRRRGQRRRGRGRQPTILVVDDEEPVRETLVEALSTQGYRVIATASAEQAEETKTRLGVAGIQLVITDVNLLPGDRARAGYAMALRWRALHPELPIILISGDPRNEDLPEVRDGSLGFLLKPFRLDTLLEAVRGRLGG